MRIKTAILKSLIIQMLACLGLFSIAWSANNDSFTLNSIDTSQATANSFDWLATDHAPLGVGDYVRINNVLYSVTFSETNSWNGAAYNFANLQQVNQINGTPLDEPNTPGTLLMAELTGSEGMIVEHFTAFPISTATWTISTVSNLSSPPYNSSIVDWPYNLHDKLNPGEYIKVNGVFYYVEASDYFSSITPGNVWARLQQINTITGIPLDEPANPGTPLWANLSGMEGQVIEHFPVWPGLNGYLKINSIGTSNCPSNCSVDWPSAEYQPLSNGMYLKIKDVFYFVDQSENNSWNGTTYNWASLLQCDQDNGNILDDPNQPGQPLYADFIDLDITGEWAAIYGVWPYEAITWTVNSVNSSYPSDIDWHSAEHGVLTPGEYIRVDGEFYIVAISQTGSWSGPDFTLASLQKCDQFTGSPLLDQTNQPVTADLTGKAGKAIEVFGSWPGFAGSVKIFSIAPDSKDGFDWLASEHQPLIPGSYIKIKGRFYYVYESDVNSSWNGLAYNWAWLVQCDQFTGDPIIDPVSPTPYLLADLSGLENQWAEIYNSWPAVPRPWQVQSISPGAQPLPQTMSLIDWDFIAHSPLQQGEYLKINERFYYVQESGVMADIVYADLRECDQTTGVPMVNAYSDPLMADMTGSEGALIEHFLTWPGLSGNITIVQIDSAQPSVISWLAAEHAPLQDGSYLKINNIFYLVAASGEIYAGDFTQNWADLIQCDQVTGVIFTDPNVQGAPLPADLSGHEGQTAEIYGQWPNNTKIDFTIHSVSDWQTPQKTASMDWHIALHPPLAANTFVWINNNLYLVAMSGNNSWSGTDYNWANLIECDEKTGRPLDDLANPPGALFADLTGLEEAKVNVVTERFIDNGDGTITDTVTNLMWLKDADCLGQKNWNNALITAINPQAANCVDYVGTYEGWQLPDKSTLEGVFTNTPKGDIIKVVSWITNNGFIMSIPPSGGYWSATHFTNADDAYTFPLTNGDSFPNPTENLHSAWAVRSPTGSLGSPVIQPSPTSFDFGTVNIAGTTPGVKTLTLSNNGTSYMSITSLSFTGSDIAYFYIQNDTCSNTIQFPNESCTVDLVYAPSLEGPSLANLEIQGNYGLPILTIKLSGNSIFDSDGDNVSDLLDNCPFVLNPQQMDCDIDGKGDTCDTDYPCIVSGLKQQKIMAFDGEAGDKFGASVAVSGKYAIVGTNYDTVSSPESGSAYIYHFKENNWIEQQKITASDGSIQDHFGSSVSISGNFAIVSAPHDDENGADSGSVYIYYNNGNIWEQQQKLIASDGAPNDLFGLSVSISNNYAIISAYDDYLGQNSGSAYIFHYNGTNWIEQQKLMASDGKAGDHFGTAVSISGNTAIIGALGTDSYSGATYVYQYDGTSWIEQQKLTASDGLANYYFGWSVSIFGNFIIVGASRDGENGYQSGSSYIFNYDGNSWVEQQKILASNGAAYDGFGWSVSISNNYAIISAPKRDTTSSNPGSAYLYYYDGVSWSEQHILNASDGIFTNLFGQSVSISADSAFITAWKDDGNGSNSGSAYIYSGFAAGNETTYEDGEDITTTGWLIHDNFPAVATISNIYDLNKGSRVIDLNGNGIMNAYSLQNNDGSPWNNTSQFNLNMAVNFNEHFAIIVKVETTQGLRLLTYAPVASNGWGGKVYINYGLGTNMSNGTWQTVSRDLQADLTAAQPGNTILAVNGLIVRGSGRLDDIALQ